eukprot:1030866-Pelagomonas_calceolata.AAC.2
MQEDPDCEDAINQGAGLSTSPRPRRSSPGRKHNTTAGTQHIFSRSQASWSGCSSMPSLEGDTLSEKLVKCQRMTVMVPSQLLCAVTPCQGKVSSEELVGLHGNVNTVEDNGTGGGVASKAENWHIPCMHQHFSDSPASLDWRPPLLLSWLFVDLNFVNKSSSYLCNASTLFKAQSSHQG